ncbi:hypothetical protein NQ314_004204 [Rhamnusium bicolor]|uniref:PHD-type domain-containing protein n=1 Tax=Rhamnusium bicolor TaxID=1586634 RepID=A0AAV8ZK73_9CUCU|nr:hypothetical protein NQ314_004204 [Rhamnusium bicolor]
MREIEKENEIEHDDEANQSAFKHKCDICQDLESDTEIENEKNVGCDLCPRWYHLGCTKFTGLSYSQISNLDFTCDFCDD